LLSCEIAKNIDGFEKDFRVRGMPSTNYRQLAVGSLGGSNHFQKVAIFFANFGPSVFQ